MMKLNIPSMRIVLVVAVLVTASCANEGQQPTDATKEGAYDYAGGYPTQATIDRAFYEWSLWVWLQCKHCSIAMLKNPI